MRTKSKSIYTCQSCGYQSPKWLGRCPDCANWNSFVQEDYLQPAASGARLKDRLGVYTQEPVLLREVSSLSGELRVQTKIAELDRVLGGGVVEGSVVLIGGDPGVGKSTISLQVANQLTGKNKTVLYISGEESVAQTKLRAERLGNLGQGNLYIVSQNDLSLILSYMQKLRPQMVVIDSIQVIFDPSIGSAPGSVTQVRECAGKLTQIAKASNTSLFIIGHVTKEGAIAGPRILEHIVDTVLYFEGDRFSTYRILRAVKNRFGSTNEIGVFEMGSCGLTEVANPSQIFLSERPEHVPGSVVVSIVEGTRPLLVEIQALVSKTSFGYPRRRAQGFDTNRLSLLVAVLEKRLGLHLAMEDIYVNVAGGIKADDPGADLAVAAAVVSAFREQPLRSGSVVLGEVGLAGEIRSITQLSVRLQEAAKMGFKSVVLPEHNYRTFKKKQTTLELVPASSVKEALEIVLA